MTDFRELYEHAYWNVRAVLEEAEHSLETPHSLWGALNELIETCDAMEISLDITNRTDAFTRNTKEEPNDQ